MRAAVGPAPGGGGQARPSLRLLNLPGSARPFSPPSPLVPHKSSRGARARPRAALVADLPPQSRDLEWGGGPRGEQCSPGSGSRLLASGGIEGELVLELQQERLRLDLRRGENRELSRMKEGEGSGGGALRPGETIILLGREGYRLH